MLEKMLWSLFVQTGDIKTYLEYKKVKQKTDKKTQQILIDTYSLR